jgi:L-threonylcarbamoyladenylate synthase
MPDPIGEAVGWLREGGLLAYPTETVWGLGAVADCATGMARLRAWKGRGVGDPVAVLVERFVDLPALGFEVSAAARRLADAFWPGPLTLVLPCRRRFADDIARPDGAVGVRCSAHPLAAALARRLRREDVAPITATSLNPTGAPPARTREEAREMCRAQPGAPHMIEVEGAEAGGDAASSVVDLTGESARVLRWGALPSKELEPVLREIASS